MDTSVHCPLSTVHYLTPPTTYHLPPTIHPPVHPSSVVTRLPPHTHYSHSVCIALVLPPRSLYSLVVASPHSFPSPCSQLQPQPRLHCHLFFACGPLPSCPHSALTWPHLSVPAAVHLAAVCILCPACPPVLPPSPSICPFTLRSMCGGLCLVYSQTQTVMSRERVGRLAPHMPHPLATPAADGAHTDAQRGVEAVEDRSEG